MFQTSKSPIKVTGIPHSNGTYQENRKCKRCVEFHVDGVSFDCKELLGHLGSAGIGLDLKATVRYELDGCLPSVPPFSPAVKWPSFVWLSF